MSLMKVATCKTRRILLATLDVFCAEYGYVGPFARFLRAIRSTRRRPPVSSLLSIGAKQMRFPYVRAVFRGRLPEWFLAEVAIEEVTETRFAVDTVESTTDCLNDPLFMHRPTLNLQF